MNKGKSKIGYIELDSKITLDDFYKIIGLIEEEKQATAKEIIDLLEEQGHGGGNWRRLIIQLKGKYDL